MRKRYPSDLADQQWARIWPVFEGTCWGRPRVVPARDIVNAILYVMKNGCSWRALPHDMPKWQTVFVQRLRWKRSRPLAFAVLPGNLQDAAGARRLIPDAKRLHPSLQLVLGDKAYRQRPLREELAALSVAVDGDSPPLPKGTICRPMPMRWRIEQFFAWLCKWRRLAKNWCFSLSGFYNDVGWSLLGLSLRRTGC